MIYLIASANEVQTEDNPMFGTWKVISITKWGKITHEGLWELYRKGATVLLDNVKLKRTVRYKFGANKADWCIYIQKSPTRYGTGGFCDVIFSGKDKFKVIGKMHTFLFTRAKKDFATDIFPSIINFPIH
jgi:hypothetical protein